MWYPLEQDAESLIPNSVDAIDCKSLRSKLRVDDIAMMPSNKESGEEGRGGSSDCCCSLQVQAEMETMVEINQDLRLQPVHFTDSRDASNLCLMHIQKASALLYNILKDGQFSDEQTVHAESGEQQFGDGHGKRSKYTIM